MRYVVAKSIADVGFSESEVQYCNLWNPTGTNWGACQTRAQYCRRLPVRLCVVSWLECIAMLRTGRAGGGDIVKLEAYCSGKQIMFPFPKVPGHKLRLRPLPNDCTAVAMPCSTTRWGWSLAVFLFTMTHLQWALTQLLRGTYFGSCRCSL